MKSKSLFGALFALLLCAGIAWAEGHFGGVGLVLAVHKDALTVIHVIPDSPTAKAGLSSGLLLRKIDGTPTQGKLLKDCIEMVRGEAGTRVTLELVDVAHDKTNTVELVRAEVKP